MMVVASLPRYNSNKRKQSLIIHSSIFILSTLPVPGMSNTAEFRPHVSPGQRRKQHVAQACKGNRDQHYLTGYNMQDKEQLIVELYSK